MLSEVAGEGAGAVTVPDGASPRAALALVAGAGGGGHATVPAHSDRATVPRHFE